MRSTLVRIVASCLSSLLLVGLAAVPAAAADASSVRIDVGLTDPAGAATVLANLGEQVLSSKPVTGLAAITVDVPADAVDAALATLAGDAAHVRFAEVDGVVHANSDPYDGTTRAAYNYDRIFEAQTWGTGSPSVTVAVVDTGVTSTVELPAARLAPGFDFVDGDTDPADDDEHGTMVAALIAAEADNGVGFNGICSQCRVMPIRVLGHREGTAAMGSAADVAAGIVFAADHGAQVINLSLGTETSSRLLEEAVRHASEKGSLVVAAAGNTGTSIREYPAAIEPALAVGSMVDGGSGGKRNSRADKWIDIGAETNLATTGPQANRRHITKTSASSALVAGVAALGFAAKPGTTAATVRAAILGGAVRNPVNNNVDDPGSIDAAYAVHHSGGADTVAPVLTDNGLTAGQTLTLRATVLTPVVTDDHAIQRLEEIAGGKVIATSLSTSRTKLYAIAPHGARGPLPVTIRAYDYAGNYDEMTTVVNAEATSPVASIVSPVEGAHVRSGPVPVIVRLAEGSSPVNRVVSYSANGTVEFTRVAGTDDWAGAVVPSSEGLIQVNLQGVSGLSIVRSLKLVIDDSGPTATGIAPRNQVRVRGTFTSSIEDVADASGIAQAQLWANGKYVGADTMAPYSLAVQTGTLNGTVDLTWKLTDTLGNTRDYTGQVIADNAGPTVAITSAPGHKAKVKGTVTIAVKATDPSGVSHVELLVNGKVVARDSTSAYLLAVNTARQAKTMKIQIRAYDKLGNVSYSSARTWYRK
ncbi:S8 family serine peptidase [Actinoplanes regularis]|uniref:S8 family serine peptidase n=1 Tax=Actinoplanes regularis TaxID=52697 RepID=UPI000B775B59|nr:S8 family serine peptidase [Actinoplanes regularis]GIE91737.1 hypothetical protein Are01nite_82170 [Actinoplanes regularis]